MHLVADLRATVTWAESQHRRWAFTNRNAGAWYTDFYADLDELGRINWEAVQSTDFRDPGIKDGKQAEFLIHEQFPWSLVEEIGVLNQKIATSVETAIGSSDRQPRVRIRPDWYY